MSERLPMVRVLAGGPFHPTHAQFAMLPEWTSGTVRVACHDGADVFDHLVDCDLFIAAGLHWTGLGDGSASWLAWPDGHERCGYRSPSPVQRSAFRSYVASGRPVLGFHGGIACFDDWSEFGTLLGFRWDWKVTAHSPEGTWKVEVTGDHPVVEGVPSFTLHDELYHHVQITPEMDFAVHASAAYHDVRFPMILSACGGRIAGAGRTAYLANGHSLASTSCPELQRVIANTVSWLLS